MSSTVEAATEIRPFHVDVPEDALDDLRRRIAATQWPEKETVADESQGVSLALIQELAKYWATEAQGRIVDACLQLHGGYGYMLEYPIARAYADARVNRIYGGSNEIMLEIVGRSLGLGEPHSG